MKNFILYFSFPTSFTMLNRYRLPVLCALIIALLATLLYAPFFHNAPVFDDAGLYNNLTVYDFAHTPFGRPRTFPYFTIGLIQVLFGSIEANRIVSLALHILCSWMLFALLIALQRQAFPLSNPATDADKQQSIKITIIAFLGATWFALNPVAVYGAGYLVQRTILFATLFSLLSLWFFRRAFAENRTADVITAAVFYAAAVYSKEHAIMLPAAAAVMTALYDGDLRTKAKRIGLYFLLCIPSAIAAVRVATTVIATSYEPAADTIIAQMPHFSILGMHVGKWPTSIIMQMSFFFDYLSYWAIPDVRMLSADMRIDFAALFTNWWFFIKAFFFLGCPITGLVLLKRGGAAALFGCGLFYSWLLFFTELVSIRFREPFVLYRSYLWAPGFILMGVALCRALPMRLLLSLAVPAFVILILLSRDRL
ncbi:MAG: hypothetical protein JSS58_01380, partial [Proteobacteria bacterium]|nr:hypothetical protein [Pseudomonadota bacterium]